MGIIVPNADEVSRLLTHDIMNAIDMFHQLGPPAGE
jgi:hypothetical protein